MRSTAAAIALIAAAARAAGPAAAESVPLGCGLYAYPAEIVRVIDGDTVEADIDLGFSTWRRGERLRLDGVDAPEIRGATREAGLAAAAALRARIEGRALVICTLRDRTEKYGRYLVRIFDGTELVNDWLIEAGYATPWQPRAPAAAGSDPDTGPTPSAKPAAPQSAMPPPERPAMASPGPRGPHAPDRQLAGPPAPS